MESWYVSMVLNRCPSCAEGQLFAGWLKLHETCPHCRARFERWPGSWTGPTVGAYGVGAIVGMLAFWIAWRTGTIDAPYINWAIAGVAGAASLLAYRFAKGAWIGMMYDWGYVYADPEKQHDAA